MCAKYSHHSKKSIIIGAIIILLIVLLPLFFQGDKLPCCVEINFSSSVRNDLTGKLRLATTSDGRVPFTYALEYYNKYFKSDEEIHAIWDATRGTTTRLMVAYNQLYISTFDHVEGEEHDAKLLFSGRLQSERIIDIKTGKEVY